MKVNKTYEALGANSMNRNPKDLFMNPDVKKPSGLMFHQGASGTIPSHWNNSPFLSGGRLTSAFGANPKKKKNNNKVLSYTQFIEISKKHS